MENLFIGSDLNTKIANMNTEIKHISTKLPFDSFAASRIGGRIENQDTAAYNETPHGLLLVVCDGMGGGPAGKVASTIAAGEICRYVEEYEGNASLPDIISEAIVSAHKKVLEEVERNRALTGMGTTAAVLLINNNAAYCAHIGDSRIYQYRRNHIKFRTKDHSVVASDPNLTEEEARTAPNSNIITQALGHREVIPDTAVLSYEKGDRFLICSDGVWNMQPAKDLTITVTKPVNAGGAISEIMMRTDELGMEHGGHHDNLTAIVLDTKINSKIRDKMTRKARIMLMVMGVLLIISIVINLILFVLNHKSDNRNSELQEHIKQQEVRISTLNKAVEQTTVVARNAADAATAANDAAAKADAAARQAQQVAQNQQIATSTSTAATTTTNIARYTVKKGTTLSSIINSHNKKYKTKYTVDQVLKYNKLRNANKIAAGQIINIPIR